MDESPVFIHNVEVSADDIDDLGHASNIAYLRWLQDAAVAHSTSVGLGYEGYLKLGGVFVIRRQEIDYLRPALRGDRLELRTKIASLSAAKSERATEILRDGVAIARGLTTWGYVDLREGRPARIPDDVRTAFGISPRKRANGR